jgi:DNA-binding transcriptional LysR family regulator
MPYDSRMDMRTLRCFLAVAEEGSITRAALRLHMSQPPLSVRLQALERELDVALLLRHGRGVELTTAGRVLEERARRLLADADATAEAVRSVGQGMRGHLSVTVGATVAPRLLAKLLAAMRASAPDVEVGVTDAAGADVLDAVGHADADAGLIHLGPADPAGAPGANAKPRAGQHALEIAVVDREPLVAVLPVAHPQAAGERVDLATLRDDVLVAPARASGPGLHEHVLAAWRSVDGDPDRVLESGSITTALALVQGGVGVAILPAALAAVAWRGLVAAPLRQHRPAVETAVVWRPSATSPVVRRFLRLALSTPEPDVLGPGHRRRRDADPA